MSVTPNFLKIDRYSHDGQFQRLLLVGKTVHATHYVDSHDPSTGTFGPVPDDTEPGEYYVVGDRGGDGKELVDFPGTITITVDE